MARPWIDVDWNAAQPEASDVRRSHGRLSFRDWNIDDPAAAAVLDELRRSRVNGGALLKRFSLEHGDDVLHWFASHDQFAEYDFFRVFLRYAGAQGAVPELTASPRPKRAVGFEHIRTGTWTLDGELAMTLVAGGAYARFEGTPSDAKRVCTAFVDVLVEDRHREFTVYRSYEPWSPWFMAIAWDITWLLIDRGRNEVTLLCVTDTD